VIFRFDMRPGRVTGFLAPGGSGKSTTMRLILGLDHRDAGHAAMEKHVASIFAKVGLPVSEADNRRVLAVLRHVGRLIRCGTPPQQLTFGEGYGGHRRHHLLAWPRLMGRPRRRAAGHLRGG
jgi:ABC-type sulfate/molybdate transport systems ATPase subunit